VGFKCEINYILRLRPEQGLDESKLAAGTIVDFKKSEHRIYPVDAPIDLANENWELIARVAVRSFTVGGGSTSGRAEVLLVYDAETKAAITRLVADGESLNGRTATWALSVLSQGAWHQPSKGSG
jgi:hypothetical protein